VSARCSVWPWARNALEPRLHKRGHNRCTCNRPGLLRRGGSSADRRPVGIVGELPCKLPLRRSHHVMLSRSAGSPGRDVTRLAAVLPITIHRLPPESVLAALSETADATRYH